MKSNRRWLMALTLGIFLLAPLTAQAGPRRGVVVRPIRPKPVLVLKVVTPAPKLVKKVWVAGHWKQNPRGKRVWVPGHWQIIRR